MSATPAASPAPEVRSTAEERVLVLDFGRRIAEASPHQVQHDPAVVAAYLGAPAA